MLYSLHSTIQCFLYPRASTLTVNLTTKIDCGGSKNYISQFVFERSFQLYNFFSRRSWSRWLNLWSKLDLGKHGRTIFWNGGSIDIFLRIVLILLRLLLIFIILKVVTPYDNLLSRKACKVGMPLLRTYMSWLTMGNTYNTTYLLTLNAHTNFQSNYFHRKCSHTYLFS